MKHFRERTISAALRGILTPHVVKEEEMKLAINTNGGQVVIQFPRPIQLVRLAPDQAEAFANALLAHAKEARKPAETASPDVNPNKE